METRNLSGTTMETRHLCGTTMETRHLRGSTMETRHAQTKHRHPFKTPTPTTFSTGLCRALTCPLVLSVYKATYPSDGHPATLTNCYTPPCRALQMINVLAPAHIFTYYISVL